MEQAIKMLKWQIKNIDRLYDRMKEILETSDRDKERNTMILTRLENERASALEGLAAINP